MSHKQSERERQLKLALLDCAGVCYDVNFTQNRILGDPIQVIDGVQHHILKVIGKQENCPWTEMVEYWANRMPKEEVEKFVDFSYIPNIVERYNGGEERLSIRFWTYDVLGNTMLAEQIVRLYRDEISGDLLGLIYVSNAGEIYALQQKEKKYNEVTSLINVLQNASINLPGGYHRCSYDEGYPFLFISKSFERIVGYTKEEIERELDNKFINLVIPEDMPLFSSLVSQIDEQGSGDVAYRIRRKDGEIRWVQDSTTAVDWDGQLCYQCNIADITDFVRRQEQLAKNMGALEEFAEKIPCGYHRCTTKNGFLLDFVSDSFLETVGYQREEILGKPFINLVAPEDREKFMRHEPQLVNEGRVDLVYRLMCKDGSYRWIKDSTVRVVYCGEETYQCILADITSFVNEQERMLKENLELIQKENLMTLMGENMPGGYHRCYAKEGCPFIYIGDHFIDIVGFTKEEIERDFNNLYINLLWHEDVDKISTYEQMLAMRGNGNVYDTSVYRVKHKNGGYRWVTDSTMFVDAGEDSFFQAIISDVTEYIEGINAAKKEAEESNLAKTTFLFNASHDIRTPMNAIQGFAKIIDDNADNAKVVKDSVRKILQSSNTLMTLLNDVLDLSRIERGKDYIDLQPLDMGAYALKLFEMFKAEMEGAKISFTMQNNLIHPLVLADELKLTRIAMNILSNAKKFTPAHGKVTFGVIESEYNGECANYSLQVCDTGIGMSEEFQKRAFEQFERERSSTESGIEGSGLGLAIIKRYTDLMGGTCSINSKIGEGTQIVVTIPLKLSSNDENTTIEQLANLNFSGKRVLLVEDNNFNREIARYIFEGLGFIVDEAVNGLECLSMVKSAADGYYDAILMDIQMPVMDGYVATENIRALESKAKANLPIIAMTANAFEGDRQKCFMIGMNGHIGKPLEMEAVLKELYHVLVNK